MKKTLVVAAICFPPSLIGPAILMGNLFRKFPKNSCHVLMGHLEHIWCRKDMQSKLDCSYHFSRYPSLNYNGTLFNRIRSILKDIYAIFEIFWKGLKIITTEKIDCIFVVADHYVELAALLMHWLTGKKIVLYLPDLYYVPDSSKNNWTQILKRAIEPLMLRVVKTVLVTAEPTQEYYEEKYNIETEVLPHSVDMASYIFQHKRSHSKKKPIKILFTGTVEPCNYGALLDMVKVITELPELNLEFNIVSNNVSKQIEEIGMKNPRVVCSQEKREEIPYLQQSVDILFLPLSFEIHGYHHASIVRTASPSKLPEYFAAGRPILVYAPPESYYARYAQEKGFGLLVDQPDPNLLGLAIRSLLNDDALCQRLVDNARRVATEYHDAMKVAARLQNFLGATKKET